MVGIDNDSNFESYEFEKTYDFSVEIPFVDEDTGEYTREIELVAGQITFFGDADWDSTEKEYVYNFSWEESTRTFSHYGNAPDKEDEFIKDFKEYLLQQGVERYNIGW